MEDRRTHDRRSPGRDGGRRAMDIQPLWLSISDYGRVYGLSRSKVYEFLACGLLLTYEVGTLRRIRNLPPDSTGHKAEVA